MACTDYIAVDVPDCISPIIVRADLTPATAYAYRVTGDSLAVYWNSMTTDVDGSFEIDISLFPDEYFNRFSGLYTLSVYDPATKTPVQIKGYDEIVMRFVKSNEAAAVIL